VICPHCDNDTPATLPYCQSCGLALDLTFDKVQESFQDQAAEKAIADTEAVTLSWMLVAVCALLLALAARLMLVPEPLEAIVLAPVMVAPPDPKAEGVEAQAGPELLLPLDAPDMALPK
jgi:hypothetical protein